MKIILSALITTFLLNHPLAAQHNGPNVFQNKQEAKVDFEDSTIIEINKEGKVLIGQQIYTLKKIKTHIQTMHKISPNRPITIWAAQNTTVGQAFKIFNICKSVGMSNVTIAAKEK